MPSRPNLLFLMTDQMQGRVLAPEHPCRTPNFDRLAARGVRFPRAYTPNPVCSPARASLMTGLLPHNHGVEQVNHCVHRYESNLLPDPVHFAQRLSDAGYRTGYFGKWHVDRTNRLENFGWQTYELMGSPAWRARAGEKPTFSLEQFTVGPEGFRPQRLYGVHDQPPERRGLGIACDLAENWLDDAAGDSPWCCFVSISEPHDPYVTSQPFYDLYDPAAIEPPENWADDLAGRPNLYRKAARVYASMTLQEKQEAAACYWALVSEIDQQYGRLLDRLEAMGAADDTIVVVTSDHGDFLGAHGLYHKNVGAFDEAYNIPLILAGPGIVEGAVCDGRVGLHDLCPTLLELCGAEPIEIPDSRSFAPLLESPEEASDWQTGYAEYYGTRYWWSQRVIWDGPWKLVWNGFDFDELYQLEEDPGELRNRIDDPECAPVVRRLMRRAYEIINRTDDHPLGQLHASSLRLAPFGPDILQDEAYAPAE